MISRRRTMPRLKTKPAARTRTPISALSAYGKARATIQGTPLSHQELRRIHALWRACNYLMCGMLHLRDNPLLRKRLADAHIKQRLLGHWGSSPGLAFLYLHLSRLIKKLDLDMIFLAGPGHGAPGVLAPCYLDGYSSAIHPDKSEDEDRLRLLFKEFSFRAASAATARRRPQARSTKVGSSATCSRTPAVRRSTTPI